MRGKFPKGVSFIDIAHFVFWFCASKLSQILRPGPNGTRKLLPPIASNNEQ